MERWLIDLVHAVVNSLVKRWRLGLRNETLWWISAILDLIVICFHSTILRIHSFRLILRWNELWIALKRPLTVSFATDRLNILTVVLIICPCILTRCSLMIYHLWVRRWYVWGRLWGHIEVKFGILSCVHRRRILLGMHTHICRDRCLWCILRHHLVILGCAGQLSAPPLLSASSIIRLLHRSLRVLNWFYLVI